MGIPAEEQRRGYLYGLCAYSAWGVIPLYFVQLRPLPADAILAHRVVWTLLLVVVLTFLTRKTRDIARVFRSPKLVLTLLVTASLLGANWLLYIHAVTSGRAIEGSIGYYMMPLVNAFLATLFLGERLRPLHYPALLLIVAGVILPFARTGELTWIPAALVVSFGVYGLLRKVAAVDSFVGLAVEMLFLFPGALLYLILIRNDPERRFPEETSRALVLLLSGVVTLAPMLAYTISLRALPLLATNMMQFLNPTLQFACATLVLGEAVVTRNLIALGCVLAAGGLFALDALLRPKALSR